MPEVVLSAKGPCFANDDFSAFCSGNGIRHLTTAPNYMASSGLAEQAVQTEKRALKAK